jgi:hypothetical protein
VFLAALKCDAVDQTLLIDLVVGKKSIDLVELVRNVLFLKMFGGNWAKIA